MLLRPIRIALLILISFEIQNYSFAECKDNGIPQGISCLHCMDRRVKSSTLRIVEALGSSCLSNVALAFMLDDSFGIDQSIIKNSVELLLSHSKNVTLHLYFLNGSAIRKADSKMFSGFLNNIPPDILRERIKSDPKTRLQIKEYIESFIPLIRWAYHKGVKLSICPMLEDNLDNKSYDQLLSIARSTIPASIKVTWTRNPCPDCFAGNQSKVPANVKREDHYGELPLKSQTAISSNDGWGYVAFKSDKLLVPSTIFAQGRIQKSLYLDELSNYRDASIAKGATFLLWFSKYQATNMAKTQLPWRDRKLPTPTTKELKEITEFFGVN